MIRKINYAQLFLCVALMTVSVLACKERGKRKEFFYYNDSLELTLFFDVDNKLEKFLLVRPRNQKLREAKIQNFDSLVIPAVGALGIKFNTSMENAEMLFGPPRSYGYIDHDSFKTTWAGWVLDTIHYINLEFKNDSLREIKSNVKWARLPKEIYIGASKDTVLARYGKPDYATKEPKIIE